MSTAKVKQAPARTAAKARTAPATPAKVEAPAPKPVAVEAVAVEAVAAEAVPADLAQVADTAMLAAAAATEESVRQVEQAVAAGSETMEKMVKASQDETVKTLDKVSEMTKGQAQAAAAAQSEALKTYHKSVQSTKETVDAALKSGTTLAHGLQEIGKTMLGLTQASIEDSVSTSKKIMEAKSLHEVVELQADFGKANMDRMVAEGTRLADMTAELYRDAFGPLTAQMQSAMDKLGKMRG